MNFIDAVKGLEKGKVFKREGWDKGFANEFEMLIKDEYGVLKTISSTFISSYEPTDEDVLADDWIETEKDKYVLKDILEENGLQEFIIADASFSHLVKDFLPEADGFRRAEFKQLMKYLDISYDEKYKEEIDNLMNPTVSDFDYNYHKCPICDAHTTPGGGHTYQECPNGCVQYDVDPQGETVGVNLFDSNFEDEHFLLSLYADGLYNDDRMMNVDLVKFQEAIAYWRENERYKERIKGKKEDA